MTDIGELAVCIARMEAKQDYLIEKVDEHMGEDKEKFVDHEKRVRSLEASKWRVQGFAALVAGGVSTLIATYIKGNM